MIFKTKKELYECLNTFNWNEKKETIFSSVYFLVKYGEYIEPVYFTSYKDVWFPSGCCLMKYPVNNDALVDFVKYHYDEESFEEAYEYEKMMCKNGWHYSIECFQCEPFLPDEIKILQVLTETECLDWLLRHEEQTGKGCE